MGVQKEGAINGSGHVGGFFQLFDWSSKSRKKLFSCKSDIPERSNKGKKVYGNIPVTRNHLIDEDETVATSFKGGSEYICASSVTDDEGYGSKAPSVVARLMGLDALPPSNAVEPYSSPFFETQSFHNAPYHRKNVDYYHDHQLMFSGNLLMEGPTRYTVEGPTRYTVEPKAQKVHSRPIEKFQTEMLPPRSAKSIPITHHKLLSPIKNPGFVPTKSAAHIMEAAARMIEPGPQATVKPKMPILGSSSAPFKVQALKEKAEASRQVTQLGSSSETFRVRESTEKVEGTYKISRPSEVSRKPVESNAAKYLKGQSLNKSWNGSVDTSFKASSDTEEDTSKNKGKSVSLAIQAKVNVQKRGQNSSRNRSLAAQREQSEARSTQSVRSQPNFQKNLHRKPSGHNASGALKQNNQKQNCLTDKDKLPSKPLASNLQVRKPVPDEFSSGRHKSSVRNNGNSKVGSRKLISEAKETSDSSTTSYTRKKRTIDGNFHFNKERVVDNMSGNKNEKPVQSNSARDKQCSWSEDCIKKGGMDVVSFTFTAPLTRSFPTTESPVQVTPKDNSICMDHRGKRLLLDTDSLKLSSLGYNVIGGDALSMLLEQKLKELSYGAESSSTHESVKMESSSTAYNGDVDSCSNANTARKRVNDERDQHLFVTDKLGSQCDSEFSSTDAAAFKCRNKFLGVDKVDEGRHPSPVSILEPSLSYESYESSVGSDSNSTEASKLCSSIQAQEVNGFNSSKKFPCIEADTELSDSASSSSAGTVARPHAATVFMPKPSSSDEWELGYIKETLCNMEFMFQDFALGRSQEIMNPHLFNLLESRRGRNNKDGSNTRLRRKELFDCTSERLDFRCRRYVGGGYKAWGKGTAMVRRKDILAEEFYKGFSALTSMGDCMVDELVDKDMSSQYGRWLEFETDEFAVGVEIEGQILNSLVDEVVADMLKLQCQQKTRVQYFHQLLSPLKFA